MILQLDLVSIASAGRWEETPYKKWSEATAVRKGMKNVVSSKPPLSYQLKAL